MALESLDDKLVCPKCHCLTAECTYSGDVGGDERVVDLYELNCSNCGHYDQKKIDDGNPNSDTGYFGTSCPWCDGRPMDHLN